VTGFWRSVAEASAAITMTTGATVALFRFGPLRWLWRRNVKTPVDEWMTAKLQPMADVHGEVRSRLDSIDGRLVDGATIMATHGKRLHDLEGGQSRMLSRFDAHEAEESAWRVGAEEHRMRRDGAIEDNQQAIRTALEHLTSAVVHEEERAS